MHIFYDRNTHDALRELFPDEHIKLTLKGIQQRLRAGGKYVKDITVTTAIYDLGQLKFCNANKPGTFAQLHPIVKDADGYYGLKLPDKE